MSSVVDFTKFLASNPSITPSPPAMQSPYIEPNEPDNIQTVMNPPPAQENDPQVTPSNPSHLLAHSTMSDYTSVTEGKFRPTVKQGLRCRSCQEEMSTKEALKLHTCYSIMDRTITAEGNTSRKKVVQERLDNGPVGIRVKKTPVKKKGLSKKPNSIMRIKDKLLSSKKDPGTKAAPIQRPRLAPEQEHGVDTLVVRCIRRLYVKHPAPVSWILDRDTSQVGIRMCAVKIRRVVDDAIMENTKEVLVMEEDSDDSEFCVILDKDSDLTRGDVMKEAGITIENSSLEATMHSCSSSSANISSVLADKNTDSQAAVGRKDLNTMEVVNQHIDEAIDKVVQDSGKNKAKNIDVSTEKVQPHKSKLDIVPASIRVKKIQVRKKRLSKKPIRIMLVKDKLLSSKRDPEAAGAPIQRPRLAPEQEHCAGTQVGRCIRRLYLKHPAPVSWILDRDICQVNIRNCEVKIRRVDMARTRQILSADLDDALREDTEEVSLPQLQDDIDDPEFDVILDQEICLASGDALKKVDVTDELSIPSDDSIFEVTQTVGNEDLAPFSVPRPDRFPRNMNSCSSATADSQAAEAVSREDLDFRDVVSLHMDETIEKVVQNGRKNEYIDVSTSEAKTHKSKQTNAKKKASLSVESIVMKARRKNNCLVWVKKLCSEEIKKWIAGKSSDRNFWSAKSQSSPDRKKIKSSVPFTTSRNPSLKNVVNHFREYEKTVLDSSEDDCGKEDLHPPVHHQKKTGFRIPKFSPKKVPEVPLTSYEARAKDIVKTGGQVMSVRGFLATEKIETDACVEQFMQEGGGEAEFGNMFDRIKVLRSRESSKSYRTEDKMELNDIKHKDWDSVKHLTTDEERKQLAQDQFKNTVSSDPAVNLSFHGFRRNNSRSQLELGTERRRVVPFQSFAVSSGEMEPLPGYKMKDKTEIVTNNKDSQSSEAKKLIKLSDFAQVMKSLFYKKYARNLGAKKASQHEFDDFRAYLSHYKTGQEETLNFLSFYKENVTLDSEQTDEVMDIENQYSTFSNYYGQAETTFCSVCVTKHKFCQ